MREETGAEAVAEAPTGRISTVRGLAQAVVSAISNKVVGGLVEVFNGLSLASRGARSA